MFVGAQKARFRRDVRIVAVGAVRASQIVGTVPGYKSGVDGVAGAAQPGRRILGERGVVGAMSRMARVTLPLGNRLMWLACCKLVLESLVARITEISSGRAYPRRNQHCDAAGGHGTSAPGHQFRLSRTVGIMAPGTISLRGGGVHVGGRDAKVRRIVAAGAETLLRRRQQRLLIRPVRTVTREAILFGWGMGGRHLETLADQIVAAQTELGSFFAHQVLGLRVMRIMTERAVAIRVWQVARRGHQRLLIQLMT